MSPLALSGIAKGALLVLGVGVLAQKFQAGPGLAGLGSGITSIVAAPGIGTGLGLTGTATGIKDIAMSLGDVGRGLGDIFAFLPKIEGWGEGDLPPTGRDPPLLNGAGLVPISGGSAPALLSGGGGNVPKPRNGFTLPISMNGNGITLPISLNGNGLNVIRPPLPRPIRIGGAGGDGLGAGEF